MTKARAYSILGVNPYSSLSGIEQAFRDKFAQLNTQARYGQSMADRNRAQQQIAELKDAWDFLKKRHAQMPAYATATPRNFAQPQPVPNSQQNSTARQTWRNSVHPLALSNRHLAVSFVVAASMMLLVGLLTVAALGGFGSKKSATLRVLSVPWCNVEIDGKSVGPSGQAEPFKVTAGAHKLTFRKGRKAFSRRVQLRPNAQACVKVQFDREWVDVGQN